MSIFLILSGFIINTWGVFYLAKKKKELSDERIIEFEKKVKPKLIGLLPLSMLPILALCFYTLMTNGDISLTFVRLAFVSFFTLNLFGYFKARQIIRRSPNARHFIYVTHYFLFSGLGQLCLLSGFTYVILEYVNK